MGPLIPLLFANSPAPQLLPVSLGASFVAVASPTYCFSNDGGTTPCGDGDTIRSWKNAVDMTLYVWTGAGVGGAPARPVLRGSAGAWRADFSGASGMFDFVGTIWPTGALSVVTRFTTTTGSGNWLASPDAIGTHPFHFFRNGSGLPLKRWDNGPEQTVADSTAVTISYQGNDDDGLGSVEKMRQNGGAWNAVNDLRPTRAALSRTLWIATGPAGVYFPMTSFKTVCLFPSVLSDADFARVETWAATL